ncbi:MAG: ATP-binding protein [Gemmatimonadales bacterium]
MSFVGRLIAGTVLVLVISLAVLAFGVDRSLRNDLLTQTQSALAREVRLVAGELPADSADWQPIINSIAKRTGLRVTVIDRAGRVRAETDVPPEEVPRIENHADRPEIAAALAGSLGANQRTSRTIGEPFLYVAVPGGPGAVRVAMSLSDVESTVRRARRPVLLAALVALLLGSLLAVVAGRRVARPLGEIAATARTLAHGGAPTFPYSGIPDVDRLSGDLRTMHEQLSERFEDLKRRQMETAAIVDSMVEGVISSDARGRVITANPAARRLLGYAEQEPLPELEMLFRGKDARDAILEVIQGRAVADREVTLGERTYLLNARPMPHGGSVVVVHDLTRQKRLETVRRDFVANASHELKTPLTAISGYAETLLGDDPEPEIRRRFLETIVSNARRMQRLVDDQLDLSRIESDRWQPRPETVLLEAAAREAWSLATADAAAPPTLDFDVEAAPTIEADPDAVRQIFRNLFENAIRHSPASGRITVIALPRDGAIEVSVADTGSGIATEHLSRIFERFYRVDPSRSREQGGTGLGLSIVKHLVEGHGGRVWATSDLGRGTTIHTVWPRTADTEA